MANVIPLQRSWSLGMQTDKARDELPPNAAYNLVNLLPDYGAPLRMRGPWSKLNSSALGGAGGIDALVWADFLSGGKLAAIADDGNLYTLNTSSGAVSTVGAIQRSRSPFFHKTLLIAPANNGTSAPKSWDNSAVATLTAPAGLYGVAYRDRSWLANSNANSNRVWFSAGGDPTTWDTTDSGLWFDSTGAVTGLGPLRNVLLVFHSGTTERYVGTPDVDAYLTPLASVGCTDSRSVAVWNEWCVWASPEGVFMSDGASVIDLTEKGAVKTYWHSLMAGDTAVPIRTSWAGYSSSVALSAAIYGNYYCISVGTQDFLVCDLENRRWWRFANMPSAAPLRVTQNGSEELYFATGTSVCTLARCFNPTGVANQDGNSTYVQPILETPFYTFGTTGKKRVREVFASYDSRTLGANISYVTTPDSVSYTTPSVSLAASTHERRDRVPVREEVLGLGLKIALTATTSAPDFRLYGLDADVFPVEGSRH